MDIAPDRTLDTADHGPVIGAIRRVNLYLHYVAGGAIIVLMLIVVANIIGNLFHPPRPVPGVMELTEFGMLIMIYLGFGYAEFHGDHITVDLLYERLGKLGQSILSVFSGLVSLWVIYLMVTRLAAWAGTLAAGHYVTLNLKWPYAPFAWAAVVGAVAYFLAVACTTVINIRAARRGNE